MITIGGTASDDRVDGGDLVNDPGGAGHEWNDDLESVASVTLRSGVNVITVTAGRRGSQQEHGLTTVTQSNSRSPNPDRHGPTAPTTIAGVSRQRVFDHVGLSH